MFHYSTMETGMFTTQAESMLDILPEDEYYGPTFWWK